MRNLFCLHILKSPCMPSSRNKKVLQLVKLDGKAIEFTAPVLVKELLMRFEGFGVKSSRKSSKHLPPSFELKLGRTYYLFPSKVPNQPKNQAAAAPMEGEAETPAVVKRIKVVITKKQLEELLSKKTSVENLFMGMDKASLVDSAANWKPSLASIPEEDEFDTM